MKRSLIILLLLTVSAALILLSLDRLMGNPNRALNGFNRKFVDIKMSRNNEFKLNKFYYQISGFSNGKIYVQTKKAGHILVLDISTNTITGEKIDIPPIDKFEPAFHTTVKYPMIYITGINARKFIKGNLQTNKVEIFDLPMGPVLNTEIVDDENVIIRQVDTANYQLKFKNIDLRTKEITAEANVSLNNSESIFTYDGKLSYDSSKKKFWYVNFYCNEMAAFDKSLELKRFTTIDTVGTPKVAVAQSTSSITFSKPPTSVNKGSFAYGGKLFVHSVLIADNEQRFEGNTVIDVYDPKYQGSFYIPVPESEFVQAAFLDDQKIAVLLKDRVIVFNQNFLLQ